MWITIKYGIIYDINIIPRPTLFGIQSSKDSCIGKNIISALLLLKSKIVTLSQFGSLMVHSDLIFDIKKTELIIATCLLR